jgi:hypothetical protein
MASVVFLAKELEIRIQYFLIHRFVHHVLDYALFLFSHNEG